MTGQRFRLYVADGVIDYFGHRNASPLHPKRYGGRRQDVSLDPHVPRSLYISLSIKNGVVHESVEEQTEALERSGRHHQTHCLFMIAYEDRNPPRILALTLKVLK